MIFPLLVTDKLVSNFMKKLISSMTFLPGDGNLCLMIVPIHQLSHLKQLTS